MRLIVILCVDTILNDIPTNVSESEDEDKEDAENIVQNNVSHKDASE